MLNNLYSLKVSDRVMVRSIMALETGARWVAPADFIEQLAIGLDIRFNSCVTQVEPGLSTLPMPVLMKLVGWRDLPQFHHNPITVIRARILQPIVDTYQTIYFPEPEIPFYRISIDGQEVIAESMNPSKEEGMLQLVLKDYFGLLNVQISEEQTFNQPFGKMAPTDETVRQAFIYEATEQYGIYSLGRFATWRPLLLDDLVPDIQRIETMMQQRSKYQQRLLRSQYE